jgi:hypothetical protein
MTDSTVTGCFHNTTALTDLSDTSYAAQKRSLSASLSGSGSGCCTRAPMTASTKTPFATNEVHRGRVASPTARTHGR